MAFVIYFTHLSGFDVKLCLRFQFFTVINDVVVIAVTTIMAVGTATANLCFCVCDHRQINKNYNHLFLFCFFYYVLLCITVFNFSSPVVHTLSLTLSFYQQYIILKRIIVTILGVNYVFLYW